jgi:signal transduction histidine kinase/PAS domain-containing protein
VIEASLDLSRWPLAVAAVDRTGRVVDASPALAALFGVVAEALAGSSLLERIVEPDRGLCVAALERAFATGEPCDHRAALIGRMGDFDVRLTAFRPHAGAAPPSHVLVVAEPRVTVDAALDQALDRMSDGFIAFDTAWRYAFVNRYAEWYLGKPREELLGRTLWEVYPESRGTAQEDALRRAMNQREPLEFEQASLLRPGLFHFRAFPSSDGISFYFREVTEQKAIEARRQLLAESVDVFADVLAFESRLAKVTALLVPRLADHCVVDMLGPRGLVHAALVDGSRRGEAAHPERLGRRAHLCAVRVFERGEPELVEVVTEEWLRGSVDDPTCEAVVRHLAPRSMLLVPLISDGVSVGVLTLAMVDHARAFRPDDVPFVQLVADRAAAALAHARLHESALAARRLRDDALAIVSHDLRSPLNVVKLYAQVIARRDASATEPPAILRAVERANTLIEDLLISARLDEGKLPLDRRAEAIGPLVQEATELQQALARQREITLVAETSAVLPPASIDRHRVAQVLANLIANALKFTPKHGHVAVRTRGEPGFGCIDVIDDGPGMDDETRAHVFDRFWQAARARQAGAGLGLAIAKGIVDEHGGELRVTSAEGVGTTFTVTLPYA